MLLDDDEALTLIEVFRQHAAEREELRLADQTRRERDDEKTRRDKKREEERKDDRFERLLLATTAEVAVFRDELDEDDTATVQALMDNRRALDDATGHREALENAAHRLPDGRMVFKTEDGARVFDRQGRSVAADEVPPDAIPDAAPRWEAMKRAVDTENSLIAERDALLRYQHELDNARDRIDKGNVTKDELSKMEEALKRDMPDAVNAGLAGAGEMGRNMNANAPKQPSPPLTPVTWLPATIQPHF